VPYRNAVKVAAAMKAAQSREEAHGLIENLTVAKMLAVAEAAGVTISAGRKATVARQLVEGTVGYRLKFEAVMGGPYNGKPQEGPLGNCRVRARRQPHPGPSTPPAA
jgi:hypothetical protein